MEKRQLAIVPISSRRRNANKKQKTAPAPAADWTVLPLEIWNIIWLWFIQNEVQNKYTRSKSAVIPQVCKTWKHHYDEMEKQRFANFVAPMDDPIRAKLLMMKVLSHKKSFYLPAVVPWPNVYQTNIPAQEWGGKFELSFSYYPKEDTYEMGGTGGVSLMDALKVVEIELNLDRQNITSGALIYRAWQLFDCSFKGLYDDTFRSCRNLIDPMCNPPVTVMVRYGFTSQGDHLVRCITLQDILKVGTDPKKEFEDNPCYKECNRKQGCKLW